MTLMLVHTIAFAQGGGSSSATEPSNPAEASFKSRCANATNMDFPPCASSPSECEAVPFGIGDQGDHIWRAPFNCIFLQEPIGGKTGYDLYSVDPTGSGESGNIYKLWNGGAIVPPSSGPVQALLAYEEGKETQGPFGLLYSYLGLVYNFMSGIIIGFVILIVIVGGIRISLHGASENEATEGKKMIKKALIGMVLWFTASVILYTINPTFFTF